MSSSRGVRSGAPAANAFLAYFKPTEQPIKAHVFVKDHSIDGAGGGGHSGLARGVRPLASLPFLPWLRA